MFIKPNDQDLRILVHLAREVETYLDATQATTPGSPVPPGEVQVNLGGGSPGEVLRRFQHYMDSKFREQAVVNSHIRSTDLSKSVGVVLGKLIR